jgi:hypothetical protein
MNDGGGRGQHLMIRREIYFRSYREHSQKYPGVYPDIQGGLLRTTQAEMRRSVTPWRGGIVAPRADLGRSISVLRGIGPHPGISAIWHRTLPSRLDARTLVIAVRVALSDDGVEDGQRARRVQVARPWRQQDPCQGRRVGHIGPAFGRACPLGPGP